MKGQRLELFESEPCAGMYIVVSRAEACEAVRLSKLQTLESTLINLISLSVTRHPVRVCTLLVKKISSIFNFIISPDASLTSRARGAGTTRTSAS